MSNAEETSSKASQWKGADHQQLSEELFQCCDQDDMLIEKHCKDCMS